MRDCIRKAKDPELTRPLLRVIQPETPYRNSELYILANVYYVLSKTNFTKFFFNKSNMRRASGRDFSRERRNSWRQENEVSIEGIEVIVLPLAYSTMTDLRMFNIKTVRHFGHCNPQIPNCQDVPDADCD